LSSTSSASWMRWRNSWQSCWFRLILEW